MTSNYRSNNNRLRMKRAASADRLDSRSELFSPEPTSNFKCSLTGFPYCCTKHYGAYRRWPYYLDPPQLGYPTYRSRYWLGWPRYSYADYPYGFYYNYYYGDYRRYRPWYDSYYSEADFYGDYLRGYAEGMRKYSDSGDDAQRRRRRRTPSLTDDFVGTYGRPYYGRYL